MSCAFIMLLIVITNYALLMLIHDAYQLQDFQIIGGPKMGEGGAVQPHRNAPAKDSHAAVQPK